MQNTFEQKLRLSEGLTSIRQEMNTYADRAHSKSHLINQMQKGSKVLDKVQYGEVHEILPKQKFSFKIWRWTLTSIPWL